MSSEAVVEIVVTFKNEENMIFITPHAENNVFKLSLAAGETQMIIGRKEKLGKKLQLPHPELHLI